MKKVIVSTLLLSLFALAFSILFSAANPLQSTASPSPPDSALTTKTPASITPNAGLAYQDDSLQVRLLNNGQTTVLSMTQYLVGVISAEMPASFEMEALKAQAVAARTVTLYHMTALTSCTHPDADVCSEVSDCQGYTADDALRSRWGDDYPSFIRKIKDAIRSTDGQCLSYRGSPIQAVFHSSSAGKTADSGEVWTTSLPYLSSVTSPESAATVPNYVSTVVVSLTDFKSTVAKHYPNVVFSKDPEKWISSVTLTVSGRLSTVIIGDVTISGVSLRSMFGLRSTAAAISVSQSAVTFTTTGYGHGVGMSQYGAETFAIQGKSYVDILSWYYAGTQIVQEYTFTKK